MPAAGCPVVIRRTSLPSGNTAEAVSPNNTQADDQNQSPPRAIPKLRTRQRVMRPRCARRLTPFSLSGSGVQCANFSSGKSPSEPDWRGSRLRLSSQWGILRGGAALRLVPKDASQTFGIRQVICARRVPPLVSPCGHSRWLVVRYSVCHPSTFRRSLRSTVITRFIATTDALTPGGRLFGPLGLERRLSPPGLPDYRARTSGHSDSTHLRVGRDSPGCDRSFLSLQRVFPN